MPYIQNEKSTGLDPLPTPDAGDLVIVGDVSDSGRAKGSAFSDFVAAVKNYITTTLGGFVETVTGLNTDNTDPSNPIVQISVDGITVFGDGTPASPLSAVGGGASSGVGSKPITFSITDTDISAGEIPQAGYISREALVTTNGSNVNLQDADGFIQTRTFTTDWADADSLTSFVLIGTNFYVLLLDAGGTTARVYKYNASDLSLGGTLMTVSGATLTYNAKLVMTSNGTHIFLNYENGASANAYRISKFSASGTTLTFIAAVNAGSTATRFDSTFAVDTSGNYYGIAQGILYQYDTAGVLTYTGGVIAGIATNEAILNWTNTLYLNSDNDAFFVKLYLPDTEIDSTGGSKKVGVGEIGDVDWFNIQYPFVPAGGVSFEGSMWELRGGGSFNGWSQKIFADGESVSTNSGGGVGVFLPCFTGISSDLKYNSGKQAIFQQVVFTAADSATENGGGVGFDSSGGGGGGIVNMQGTNATSVGFVRKESDGTWYARASTGAAHTETLITISPNATHVLRCEYDPVNATPQARFYVDGALVATITTNLPSAIVDPIGYSFGNAAAVGVDIAISQAGAPSFAVEI